LAPVAHKDHKKAYLLRMREKRTIDDKKVLGKRGEEIAIEFLKRKGYKLIERNYRSRLGEVDIVAREKEDLVFIEVKTRRSVNFGLPEEAVSYRKRYRLTRLALGYLAHHKLNEVNCRFDVVGILMQGNKVKDINLIKAAFGAISHPGA